MKKILSLLMGAALLLAFQILWAENMKDAAGMSTPSAAITPAAKSAVKKKAKMGKKTPKFVYICPMDGTTSDKPGKCPACGMDLIKMKQTKDKTGGKTSADKS